MTLTEFLLARIAEDEDAARKATRGEWYWEPPSSKKWAVGDESLRARGSDEAVLYGWGYDASGIEATDADRAHIVRWHPARVLAECEAKRRIVEDCVHLNDMRRDVLAAHAEYVCRTLALPYADHPDYREEWRA